MNRNLTHEERALIKYGEVHDITSMFIGAVFYFMKDKKKQPVVLVSITTKVFTTSFGVVDRFTFGKMVRKSIDIINMSDAKTQKLNNDILCKFLRVITPDEEKKLNIEINKSLRERYDEFYG